MQFNRPSYHLILRFLSIIKFHSPVMPSWAFGWAGASSQRFDSTGDTEFVTQQDRGFGILDKEKAPAPLLMCFFLLLLRQGEGGGGKKDPLFVLEIGKSERLDFWELRFSVWRFVCFLGVDELSTMIFPRWGSKSLEVDINQIFGTPKGRKVIKGWQVLEK